MGGFAQKDRQKDSKAPARASEFAGRAPLVGATLHDAICNLVRRSSLTRNPEERRACAEKLQLLGNSPVARNALRLALDTAFSESIDPKPLVNELVLGKKGKNCIEAFLGACSDLLSSENTLVSRNAANAASILAIRTKEHAGLKKDLLVLLQNPDSEKGAAKVLAALCRNPDADRKEILEHVRYRDSVAPSSGTKAFLSDAKNLPPQVVTVEAA